MKRNDAKLKRIFSQKKPKRSGQSKNQQNVFLLISLPDEAKYLKEK
jgi:hypothetical protein